MSIVKAIEHHGRLGLSLRGHRDERLLKLPENDGEATRTHANLGGSIDYTQGNFKATLQLMVECNDKVQEQHLHTAAWNANKFHLCYRMQ